MKYAALMMNHVLKENMGLIFISDDLDTTGEDEEEELEDMDGDGDIDGDDLDLAHFEPGSWRAKQAWKAIQAEAKRTGIYGGKPLQPGPNEGDGDFDLIRDKAIWQDGHSQTVAERIAGYVRKQLRRK